MQTEFSQAAMREETELLSNTLKEVAKAILKDADDTSNLVDGRRKGMLMVKLKDPQDLNQPPLLDTAIFIQSVECLS